MAAILAMMAAMSSKDAQQSDDASEWVDGEFLLYLEDQIELLLERQEREGRTSSNEISAESLKQILVALRGILDPSTIEDRNVAVIQEGIRKLGRFLEDFQDKSRRYHEAILRAEKAHGHKDASLDCAEISPLRPQTVSLWERMQQLFRTNTQTSKRHETPQGHIQGSRPTLIPSHADLKKDFIRMLSSTDSYDQTERNSTRTMGRISYAFREPLELSPRGPIYAYRFADAYISQAHRSHFKRIVNIFRIAIEDSSGFAASRDWFSRIVYHLSMCGTNKHSAEASIVLSCPTGTGKEAATVLSTLNKRHILDQYAHGFAKVSYGFHVWENAFTFLGESIDCAEIHFDRGMSLCGALITPHARAHRLSTVACVVQVGKGLYALTSAHPFQLEAERVGLSERLANDPSSDDETLLEISQSNAPNIGRHTSDQFSSHISPQKLSNCHLIRPPTEPDWTGIRSNLDWSLLRLSSSHSIKPNAIQTKAWQEARKSYTIHPEPASQPLQQRPVYVILGNSDSCRGLISTSPSFMSCSNGYGQLCEVWTVLITQGRHLKVGDSGSLVVDQETTQAYGHVIATNPLGGIFIVPLIGTLKQIKDTFASSQVQLHSQQLKSSGLETDHSNNDQLPTLDSCQDLHGWALRGDDPNSDTQRRATGSGQNKLYTSGSS